MKKMNYLKQFIADALPPFLILLWVYAASSKLIEFHHFKLEMYNQVFPGWMSGILIIAVPVAEFIAAALMLWRKSVWHGILLSEILLLVFTGYIFLVYIHVFSRVPCSCGGIFKNMGWGAHLLFNLFFLLITTSAITTLNKERRLA